MSKPTAETAAENQDDKPESRSLAEQLQSAIAERDQYKDKWTRSLADLENFRKRIYANG